MTAPVNVFHVTTGMGEGGAEAMLARLIAHSDSSRVVHHLLALSNEGPLWKSTSEECARSLNLLLDHPISAVPRLAHLRQFVRDSRPDVIHGWMYHGNLAASWLGRWFAPSAKLIFGIRQSLYDIRHERPLTRAVIRAGARRSRDAAVVVYNSVLSKDQHNLQGYRSDRSCVIPNGFDIRKFVPDPSARSQTRRRLGITDAEFVIAIVARFHPVKDHATFFRAVAALARVHSSARILVVGPGCTAENAALRLMVNRYAAEATVDLLGAWSNTAELYPALDALCMTSKAEGFPNVVGEAMACGVPCVCTNVGDVPLLLGNAGFLSAVGDAESIARHLATIARFDAGQRHDASLAAREQIRAGFAIEGIIERYMKLYTEPAAASCK